MALKIEKLVTGAYGLGHEGKQTYMVKDALPGEEVTLGREQKKGSVILSRAESVSNPSPMRVEPICPLYGKCGGCDFLCVSRKDSAYLKEEMIRDNLRRISGLEEEVDFLPPAYTEERAYRSRVRFHVRLSDKSIGFLERESNNLIPIEYCPLLTDRINALLKEKNLLLKKARSMMFENRVNRNTGFIELPVQDGDREVSIGGNTIDCLGYKVNSNVFFQSDLVLLPELLDFVKENTVGDVVMDLYSGVGTFSRLFEGSGKTLYAVEREKRCLELSRKNAPSAKSFTDDVAVFSKKVRYSMDTVIVDPPRVGLASSVVDMMMKWNPERIIYVSCDSTTFCRDYKLMKDRYRISKARVFDFYPGSSHEESAFVLDRI